MPSPSINSVDLAIDSFGGRVTQFDPQKLPSGASPFNQDVIFTGVGDLATRPGMQPFYAAAFAGNPTVNYLRTFVDSLEALRQMSLDGFGNVRQEFPQGTLTIVGSVVAASFIQSDTYAGREWMAVGDGQFGIDIPRQWDGTNFDRVSQCGPGASPAAADGAAGSISAGVHQVACCFVLRSGYITDPSIPVSWTAAGSKKVNLTGIPTGPPDVVARILIFTPVITPPATAGPFFYFGGVVVSGALTFPSMVIQDNVTTTATFDFLDAVLQSATAASLYFNRVELGECSATLSYSERGFWCGERNKVNSAGGGGGFNNLTFDGGFSGAVVRTTTAFLAPGTAADAGGGSAAWTNPNNIKVLDGALATCVIPSRTSAQLPGNTSNLINATNFGFAIPGGSVITGISVGVYTKSSRAFSNYVNFLQLLIGGVGSGANRGANTQIPTTLSLLSFGGVNDLWALATLTPAIINAANFGVSFQATESITTGSAPNTTVSIDYITISVSYTAAGAGLTPLGWTAGASYAGGDSALHAGQMPYWGDAFAITGDGATAVRGQITQAAAQDYLGIPDLVVNTAYSVRARIASAGGLAAGSLNINLQSTSGAFTTQGLSVPAGMLTSSYQEFISPIIAAMASIPTDLVLQVYADGTPTNGGVFLVDCIEIFQVQQPINRTLVRVSYASDPEGFDSLTGFMVVGKDNGQAVRALVRLLDNKLYFIKERSMYVTSDDNANEPSLWVISTVSDTVGTPSVHGVAVGESWFIIASHDGLYIFWGADPVKISQEIQPDWDTINWAAGQNIYTVVDLAHKRIHVGVPTGVSTVPNVEFVLDYSQLNSAQEIADHPQAYYSVFAPGKVVAPGKARKWTVWNLSMNCAAMTLQGDGSYRLLRGNATGTGKIYDQVATQYSDDGVAIPSMYQTYFFPETEQEQILQLGSQRKLFKWMTTYSWGNGPMFFTVTGPQGQRQKSLQTLMLTAAPGHDIPMNVNWVGERASLIFGTTTVGSWFSMSKLVPTIQKELLTAVRSSA